MSSKVIGRLLTSRATAPAARVESVAVATVAPSYSTEIWLPEKTSARVWSMPGSIVALPCASRVRPLVSMCQAVARQSLITPWPG